jgi:hypothetical protein
MNELTIYNLRKCSKNRYIHSAARMALFQVGCIAVFIRQFCPHFLTFRFVESFVQEPVFVTRVLFQMKCNIKRVKELY